MQVGIDVKCIHTNFGGRSFFGFGDVTTFQNGQISLLEYSPWSLKNVIDRNRLKKFMQVGIDVKCMHTDFGGRSRSFFGFGDVATFQKRPNFPFEAWTIVHGSKGKFGRFLKYQYLRNRRGHTHQNWCAYWCACMLDRLNFLMTMDYSPWVEREIWPFFRVAISPKQEEPCPQKLVYMHVTSTPTCMNFLS